MDQTNPVASSSNSKKIVDETLFQVTTDHSNAENDLSDCEEIVVEETFIQVTPDNPDEMSDLNENSNVRLIALDSDAPALQIENKIFHFSKWKYIQGTALFFDVKKERKSLDPLYDNRCGSDLQYVGSSRKCLEMTKKDHTL